MNAREQWLTWYRSAKTTWYVKDQCRYEMRKVRREAGLERIADGLRRKVDAQANNIKQLLELMERQFDDIATLRGRIEELESDLDEYQRQEIVVIDNYPYEGDEMSRLQRDAAGG